MTYNLIIDDYICRWAYSKQLIRNELAKFQGKHVDVKISSLGGDLDHAFDIRQQFLDHGDVTVYLSGFVASSATVIAMGAKRIIMSSASAMMVHKCSNFLDVWGNYNADQIQALIDDLTENKKENDKIDVILASMYADRCGKKVADILAILKKGDWLSPQEALDLGLVDEISDKSDGAKKKLDLTPDMARKFNAFGLPAPHFATQKQEDAPDRSRQSLLDKAVAAIKTAVGAAPEQKKQTQTSVSMDKFNFKSVASLLKLDAITPDDNGQVAVSAEQMQTVSDKVGELEDTVSKKDAEIAKLNEQVKNLLDKPGDETTEIEDGGSKDDSEYTASSLYNSLKGII